LLRQHLIQARDDVAAISMLAGAGNAREGSPETLI